MTTLSSGPLLAAEPDDVGEASPAPWRRVARRLRHNRVAMTAAGFIVVIGLLALFASVLSPEDPQRQFFGHQSLLNPQTGVTQVTDVSLKNLGPSGAHWLGTDSEGRDILSRLLAGSRTSLAVSLQVIAFAVVVATPLGLVSGYFGRVVDAVVSRCMDALFAFPPLTLALAVAVLLGRQLVAVSVAIAIVFVPGFVRIIRAQVLAVREETFIHASRSVGVGDTRMLVRHVLPNVAPPLIVQAAIGFGYAVTAEAGLSVLGFGPSGSISWGSMLESAYQHLDSSTWPILPPGIAITLTVLAFNFLGDGLRDALSRDVQVSAGGVAG
jgi:ABC-type dipeptide/oligopeptide/nickel transport system permease subunit